MERRGSLNGSARHPTSKPIAPIARCQAPQPEAPLGALGPPVSSSFGGGLFFFGVAFTVFSSECFWGLLFFLIFDLAVLGFARGCFFCFFCGGFFLRGLGIRRIRPSVATPGGRRPGSYAAQRLRRLILETRLGPRTAHGWFSKFRVPNIVRGTLI